DVERIIMIGPRAQQILRLWLRADMEAYLFSPAETLDAFNAARTDERKTPWPKKGRTKRPRVRNRRRPPRDRYDVTSYRRAIARACDLAFPHPELSNIAKKALTGQQRSELAAWQSQHRWSPNQLRHAAATLVRRE